MTLSYPKTPKKLVTPKVSQLSLPFIKTRILLNCILTNLTPSLTQTLSPLIIG